MDWHEQIKPVSDFKPEKRKINQLCTRTTISIYLVDNNLGISSLPLSKQHFEREQSITKEKNGSSWNRRLSCPSSPATQLLKNRDPLTIGSAQGSLQQADGDQKQEPFCKEALGTSPLCSLQQPTRGWKASWWFSLSNEPGPNACDCSLNSGRGNTSYWMLCVNWYSKLCFYRWKNLQSKNH